MQSCTSFINTTINMDYSICSQIHLPRNDIQFSAKKSLKSFRNKKNISKTRIYKKNAEKSFKRIKSKHINIVKTVKEDNDTYITKSDLINASVEKNYLKSSKNIWNKYTSWLKNQHIHDPNYPTLQYLIVTQNMRQLNRTMMDWAVHEFNDTKNIGNTIKNKCAQILLQYNHYGIHLSLDFMPGISRICKGMNKIASKNWGKKVGKPKRAFLKPMIREMLKKCTNNNDRLRILFPFVFMLRAEHYVWNDNPVNGKPYLKIGNLQFGTINPNTNAPDSLTIHMGKDKNHQFERDLQRTAYCTCHTKWAEQCVVCLTYRVLREDLFHLNNDNPVIRDTKGKQVTYNSQLKFIKAFARILGLEEKEYGTHSLRAGGATEAFLSGHTALEIQQFGDWECLGSVLRYIRPKNPELKIFGFSCATYQKLRRDQALELAKSSNKIDWATKQRQKFISELEKEKKKMNNGKRNKASRYYYIYLPWNGKPYTIRSDDIYNDPEMYT